MARYFTCILLVVVLAIGVYSGFFLAKAMEFKREYTNQPIYGVVDLRSFVEFAKGQHKYYADHPSKCNDYTGSIEWNSRVVDYYNEIEELLR